MPHRALFTSDCTIDKLSELLADNPRGILYCVDEFDSWLGQHDAFSRDGGSRNRGEWMRLYDGGPHQVDRVKRGSFFVKNWGASVLTATTPAALTRLAQKLSADGLFQRFMVFAIRPMRDREHVAHVHRRAGAPGLRRPAARASTPIAADLVEHPIVRLSGAAAAHLRGRGETPAPADRGGGARRRRLRRTHRQARGHARARRPDVPRRQRRPPDRRRPAAPSVRRQRQRRDDAARRRVHAPRLSARARGLLLAAWRPVPPMELAQAMARSVLADKLPDFNRREITHACRAFRSAAEWQRMAALRRSKTAPGSRARRCCPNTADAGASTRGRMRCTQARANGHASGATQ